MPSPITPHGRMTLRDHMTPRESFLIGVIEALEQLSPPDD